VCQDEEISDDVNFFRHGNTVCSVEHFDAQGPAIAGRLYSGWTCAECSQLHVWFSAYIQGVSHATLVENILATKNNWA
jgi:hypothetical protein